MKMPTNTQSTNTMLYYLHITFKWYITYILPLTFLNLDSGK
jgi:hypothetical protein